MKSVKAGKKLVNKRKIKSRRKKTVNKSNRRKVKKRTVNKNKSRRRLMNRNDNGCFSWLFGRDNRELRIRPMNIENPAESIEENRESSINSLRIPIQEESLYENSISVPSRSIIIESSVSPNQ